MYFKAFKINKLRDLYFYMYVLIAQLYFSFPEIITELPTVTITELPLDRAKNRLESVILDDSQVTAGNHSDEEQHQQQPSHQDQPKKIFEADKEVPQKGKKTIPNQC